MKSNEEWCVIELLRVYKRRGFKTRSELQKYLMQEMKTMARLLDFLEGCPEKLDPDMTIKRVKIKVVND